MSEHWQRTRLDLMENGGYKSANRIDVRYFIAAGHNQVNPLATIAKIAREKLNKPIARRRI